MDIQHTSVFNAHTVEARAIVDLFYTDLAICGGIFLVVAGLVIYAVIRFRHKPGAGEPFQDPGNPKLETLWIVIPALIVTVLLVLTARTMRIVNPAVGATAPDVAVIGHQWWWEFRHPDSGIVTANELHMVAGEKWLLQIESADVIHNFWVPDLGTKMDAIPGRQNYLWLQPLNAGTFLGTCGEYCGMQHALMGIRVVVQTPADFARWIEEQKKVPPKTTGEIARRGARLFAEKTCLSCHRIAGTEARGRVGPDLTHLASRQTLAAEMLENTPANLARWIQKPQEIKPGCHMPDTQLTDDEAQAVAAYLEELK